MQVNYLHILKIVIIYFGERYMEKLEEVSRNELLALTKGETITRYNKAQAYKGFNIVNIDTEFPSLINLSKKLFVSEFERIIS